MVKFIFFISCFVMSILLNLTFSAENVGNKLQYKHSYTDCAKGDIQCEKEKKKGIEDDRRRYEKWCKEHPGKCSSKIKMFN